LKQKIDKYNFEKLDKIDRMYALVVRARNNTLTLKN